MKFFNFKITSEEKPKWEETPDGFLRCKARVLAERVMPYSKGELGEDVPVDQDIIQMLVTQETMAEPEAIRSLEGALLVAGDHTWLTPDMVSEYGMGHVAGQPVMDGPYLVCDLLLTNPEAIAAVKSGQLPEISAAYRAETVFQPGEFNGEHYDAIQTQLRYNHIAIIPEGHGRAGRDVRILNKKNNKEEIKMSDNDVKLVRIQLKNTKKFVNVDEEGASAVEEEGSVSEASLESAMSDLEAKNAEMSALQGEVEELKGQLSVYQQKLDELLSTEAIEHAAEGIVEEAGEAETIIENTPILNEKGDEDEDKKKEIMNSLKGVYGEKLYVKVLNSIGIKTEEMERGVIKGVFKAQAQIANSMKGVKKETKVAGAKMFENKQPSVVSQQKQRTGHERLGLVVTK